MLFIYEHITIMNIYLNQLENKFGPAARKELEKTTTVTLKRKILGE